jgi:hypothetical protein
VLPRLLRTAPWRRAPLALLRQPTLLLTVAAVALVLGLAASVGPLFLASTSSAVVQEDLTEGCPTASGLRVTSRGTLHPSDQFGPIGERDAALRAAVAGIAHLQSTQLTAVGPQLAVDTDGPDINVRLTYRSSLLDHIDPVDDAGGDGVWIPERAAGELGIGAGDPLVVRSPSAAETLRVRGVYRDIVLPLPPEWCAQQRTVYPAGTGEAPDRLLVADRATYARLESALTTNASRLIWETSVDRAGLTLPEADRTSAALADVATELRDHSSETSALVAPFATQLYLPDYVRVWHETRDEVREGVVPVVFTALAIALLFVVSLARSWVEQRRTTVELLLQRGVAPAWLGTMALLELALPMLVFGTLGGVVGALAVRALGPSPLLDAHSVASGIGLAYALAAIGLVLATATVVGAARRIEQDRARLRVTAVAATAEVGVLVAAGLVYARMIDHDRALAARQGGAPRVDVLHLLFPILLVIGAGAVVVRLLVLLLPILRRAGARWPVAVVLGLRRLAGSRHAVHVLGLAATVATGLVAASSIVVASADATLHAKSAVFVGGEVAARIPDPVPLPQSLRGVATVASRYVNVRDEHGRPVDLIGIDPDTLADGAFWDRTLAGASLPALLDALDTDASDAVPVITVGAAVSGGPLTLGTGANATTVRVRSVAHARSFPGERNKALYVADARVLGARDEADFAEVWSSLPSVRDLVDQLRASHVTVWGDVTADDVLTVGTFRTTAWTFDFLRALGSLIAVLTVAAVIAHVVARERRGLLGYAIARRCGLRARAYALSLAIELAVLLSGAFVVGGALGGIAAATTHHRLDGLRRLPPAPLFRVPGAGLGAAAAASLVTVVLGAWWAQRSSERADVVEVLRAET